MSKSVFVRTANCKCLPSAFRFVVKFECRVFPIKSFFTFFTIKLKFILSFQSCIRLSLIVNDSNLKNRVAILILIFSRCVIIKKNIYTLLYIHSFNGFFPSNKGAFIGGEKFDLGSSKTCTLSQPIHIVFPWINMALTENCSKLVVVTSD